MGSRRPSVDTPFSIEDFETKLKEFTVDPEEDDEGHRGKPFVRRKALTEWLASFAQPDNRATHAALLLERCFPDEGCPLPITERDILWSDMPCPLMFCILLEIRYGEYVSAFHNIGLHDGCLPKPVKELKRLFPQAVPSFNKAEIAELVTRFNEKQWAYFPQELSYRMRPLPLDFQMRLPILKRSRIGKGGTAEVYRIEVPEDFVDAELVKAAPCSTFQHKRHGLCYKFALKSFLDTSHNMCDAEITAYRHLQDHEHVIKCLGAFNHFGMDKEDRIHNILLEYGQCDLAEYFNAVNPPAVPEDVESFWAKLFKVVQAVKYIHQYKAPRGGKEESYDGWHGDIKPQNILMTEQRIQHDDSDATEMRLKLADPGFVNFVRSRSKTSRRTLSVLNGWTLTYGPPEVNQMKPAVAEPWAVDIWSIGCVLSEAATWIVLSQSGRAAYSAARQEATKKLRSMRTHPRPQGMELGVGDFFHDGQKVLSAVTEWHDCLRAMIRPNDTITGRVLDLVDTKLLLERPGDRMRADELCLKLEKLIRDAQKNRDQDDMPEDFKELIRSFRRQALETWINLSETRDGFSVEDRKAQSPAAVSAVFNFIHSTEAIKRSHVNPIESTPTRDQTNTGTEDLYKTPPRRRTTSQNTMASHGQPHHSSPGSGASEQFKTIFDSYYTQFDSDHKDKSSLKYLRRLTKSNKKTKDELLTSYYENRDIVYLVDNAGSMAPYWSEVKFTLQELVRTARNQDDDGVDLMFTGSQKTVENVKNNTLETFARVMQSGEVQPQPGVSTNISEKLCLLLHKWLNEYRLKPLSTKFMTIIILTDGQWSTPQGGDEYDIDRRLVEFGENVKNVPEFKDMIRPISIQFVSFGRDPVALARLQRLDDTLQYYGVEDIIDTEPSYGDVYQMLLGSLDPERDELNTVQSPELSPTLNHSTSYSWGGTPNSSDPSSSFSQSNSTPRSTNSSIRNSSSSQPPRASARESKRSERTFFPTAWKRSV